MEEEFDIEKMNFDEYNRQIYCETNAKKNKRNNYFNTSQAFNAQKRYKHEIDKFVAEYKSGLANSEIDEDNFRRMKKKKILN